MFSGIIEDLGKIVELQRQDGNLHLWIRCNFINQCHIDQSIAHNGVCLTIDDLNSEVYRVTAIQETLDKTNLGTLQKGNYINLERSMTMEKRLDGHIVQGHVDCRSECLKIMSIDGSWVFQFRYPSKYSHWIVNKGSVCVDGVSLTVAALTDTYFEVAIIPYTYDHTCFKYIREGDLSNLEFDIIGKYVARNMEAYRHNK